MTRRANVAISAGITDLSSIWSSGLNQNLIFLAQLLERSAAIGKVWLVNAHGGDKLPNGLGIEGLNAPLVKPEEITHEVDLVIEFGTSLPLEWLRHVKALGAKVSTLLVGHTYPGQGELAVFNREGGAIFIGTPWDEVWTLPHHMKSSAPFLRTVARAPVIAMPHIWSPLFLQEPIKRAEAMARPFGFDPDRPGWAKRSWRVAIFEPNISVVKACFIPMLVADQAYRLNHDAVGGMMVLNTFHMKEHRTFNAFALHMDLTRDGKATYEPRLPFVDCMTEHRIDAVVAHHWECALNYAYYDALYGGYPLIHNSEYLRDADVGFFYPGFEASQGAQALLKAWGQEPAYWQDYKRRADRYLARLAPDHADNIEAFSRRIVELLGDRLEA